MFQRKPGRPQKLGDLLPYLNFDRVSGILWLKDGSASFTLQLVPKNSLSSTSEDLEQLRQSLSEILNQLPDGAMAQFYFVREKTQKDNDSASKQWNKIRAATVESQLDKSTPNQELYLSKCAQIEERWKKESLFQSRIFLTLRISTDQASAYGHAIGPLSFLSSLRISKSQKPKTGIERELISLSEKVKLSLESQGFEVKHPGVDKLTALIYSTLNPERAKHVQCPENQDQEDKSLSEHLALTDLVETREGLNLGRTEIRIGSLKSYPEASSPALMTTLASESDSFAVVYTVLALSQVKERERLLRRQRMATGLAAGNHVRNLQAESQLGDIEETLAAMISRGEKLFASSLHILLQDDSLDSGSAKLRLNRLIECGEKLGGGCQWFEETVGAFPVFFGTLPFAPTFLTRPKRLLTQNLSDFIPVYGMGPGHREALTLFESPFQSLVGYSPFEKSPSGNAVILGESGSGKSVLACGLLLGANTGDSNLAPAGLVIDVGNSFKRSVLYLGGTSIDFSPGSNVTINPFDLEPGETKPSPDKVKFLSTIFDEILGETGSLTKLERALVETEILNFYAAETRPTLSKFQKRLEASSSIELNRLSKLLSLWCRPQPYGLLFDGETNATLDAPHLHFELKGCQRFPDLLRVAMLTVMEVIRRSVAKRFPKRSFAIFDEVHTLIRSPDDGRTNTSARWVDDSFRQMRKFGSSAIGITQTAQDLKSGTIEDGILANAPNRFILKQRGDEKPLKENLKINDRAIKDIFSLKQLKGHFSEFFLQSESLSTILIYRPTPLELWLSTTDPPDLVLLKKEEEQHPEMDLWALMKHMAQKYPHGAPISQEAS